MKRAIISSSNDIKLVVANKLQKKFPEIVFACENQLSRIFVLPKEKHREYVYSFATEDVAMLNGDEAYFFLLVSKDEDVEIQLKVFQEVYDPETHWRYFIILHDGNPTKIIASVLNYDVGLAVCKVHLPGENYEYLP